MLVPYDFVYKVTIDLVVSSVILTPLMNKLAAQESQGMDVILSFRTGVLVAVNNKGPLSTSHPEFLVQ